MAIIDYSPGNGAFAPPTQTFDITSVVAKRLGAFVNYYSFDTDGTMFVLHSTGGVIVGWEQFSGATSLQSATTNLDQSGVAAVSGRHAQPQPAQHPGDGVFPGHG